MQVKELLCLLEERLVQHDNNRREIQNQLQEIYSKSIEEADLLEEKLNEELQRYFNDKEEERILVLIDKLNNNTQSGDLDSLTSEALKEISNEPKFRFKRIKNANNFVNSRFFKVTNAKLIVDTEERNNSSDEDIIKRLQGHLDKIHEIIALAQNKITRICTNRRTGAEELKKKIDGELEEKFNTEDSLLQAAVSELRDNNSTTDTEDIFKTIQRAKATLLVTQTYKIVKRDYNNGGGGGGREKQRFCLMNTYELKTERNIYLKGVGFEEIKPSNLITSFTEDQGEFSLTFTFFNDDEIEIIKTATIKTTFKVKIKMWEKDKSEEKDSIIITKEYNIIEQQICFVGSFSPNTTYNLKMRIKYQDFCTKWSDETEFTTPGFKICVWKECHYVYNNTGYSVDVNNPRIAIKNVTYYYGRDYDYDYDYSTLTGSTHLPLNRVTSWNINILKSKKNDGFGIYIGVAPFDINQNGCGNYKKYGWYFDCYWSALYSGPPHKYYGKEYGPRKKKENMSTQETLLVLLWIQQKVNYRLS